ncbi:glycerol-3-phosphate dehydrogenase [Acinetobacter gandensis]|uniref:Glycerol-3-phosphate dehydrogenase n=1 Tax=Acinetobacter gandensis TaxID=1443941 RepID=A0A1A7RCN7_9GAMM|nr:glycerol-3-phosphate dehydrogenase [Acinetobacter gandensis]KAB0626148.1 glycerol-3-phosphate dehydrogenase [Acinetobacter gandensis]OBX29701.1 glycerol-3-phosphate dehydrogenase [Acinetobacter gandensis]
MQEQHPIYDMVVIGGGINGVGIACDAAGRGLSVLLCEKDDLASHTSSASSKLIHGGLRYLEHKEFRLVREALAEREVLLSKAPHIIRPMRFIMPHEPHLRPAWLIRTGLFFYDHLGKREQLAGSNQVEFSSINSPLHAEITRGFEYSDCAVDDARLVVLNAMQAKELGAKVLTRTQCLSAKTENGVWTVKLENSHGESVVRAKVLVNAAGPWVAEFLQQNLKQKSPYGVRLIQGSHIIVPKLYDGDKAFIMQNDDQRIVFAIPYLQDYTLIGTTDQEFQGDPNHVEITQHEIDYLLDVSNDHFKVQLTQDDIVASYSGVRPLCDDESDNPSAVTRDYTLSLTQVEGAVALLSVFGGKLTTYRKLAESAMTLLKPYFEHMRGVWTAAAKLPGAEHLVSLDILKLNILEQIQNLDDNTAERWTHAYGSRVWDFLKNIHNVDELGQHFGCGLYAQEVDYLVEHEWARTSQDILKRRTKLYLKFEEESVQVLDKYLISLRERRLKKEVA